MGILFVRPFHCISCYRRFYSRSKPSPAQQEDRDSAPQPGPPPLTLEGKHNQAGLHRPEMRGFSRQKCEIPVSFDIDADRQIKGVVTNISLTGCFLQSLAVVPAGSKFEIYFDIQERAHLHGLVRRSLASKGMGIEFIRTSAQNFRRLQLIAPSSVRLPSVSYLGGGSSAG
jgi:PilZ domain